MTGTVARPTPKTRVAPAAARSHKKVGRITTFTSVPVKPETLRRLRSYKVGGKTYDDILNHFMDETPTAEFWAEMDRRLKEEPDIPWETVRRKLKL